MLSNLIFTAGHGRTITFDFWRRDRRSGAVRVELCSRCLDQYRPVLGDRIRERRSGICSVGGCTRYADAFAYFEENEVSEEEF